MRTRVRKQSNKTSPIPQPQTAPAPVRKFTEQDTLGIIAMLNAPGSSKVLFDLLLSLPIEKIRAFETHLAKCVTDGVISGKLKLDSGPGPLSRARLALTDASHTLGRTCDQMLAISQSTLAILRQIWEDKERGTRWSEEVFGRIENGLWLEWDALDSAFRVGIDQMVEGRDAFNEIITSIERSHSAVIATQ